MSKLILRHYATPNPPIFAKQKIWGLGSHAQDKEKSRADARRFSWLGLVDAFQDKTQPFELIVNDILFNAG